MSPVLAGSHESFWVLVDLQESFLALKNPIESFWVFMDLHQSFWALMNPHESFWALVDSNESCLVLVGVQCPYFSREAVRFP